MSPGYLTGAIGIDYKPNENYVGVESSRGGIEFYIDKESLAKPNPFHLSC